MKRYAFCTRAGMMLIGNLLVWHLNTPQCRALTNTWTGAVSSDWFEAGNWSASVVPTTEDWHVLSSGTVSLGADATISRVELNGGVFSGGGTLTVSGAMNWKAGRMEGGGRTFIGPGATLTIDNSEDVALHNRILENAGTVVWTGNGNLQCQYGTVVTNWPERVWEVRNDKTFTYWAGEVPRFDNVGIFRKTQGTNTTTFQFVFNNYGTVEVDSGALVYSISLSR